MKLDISNIIIERPAIESEDENDTKNISSDEESVRYSRKDSVQSNSSTASTTSQISESSTNLNEEKTDVDELTNKFNSALNVDENKGQVEAEISGDSTPLNDVDELTDQFNSALNVDENKTVDGSLKEQLKSELKDADEEDLQERQPVRQQGHYSQRSGPYQSHRNVNHYSGGSVVNQSPPQYNILLNYGQLDVFGDENLARSHSASPEYIPDLVDFNPEIAGVSNEGSLPDLGDLSDILNNSPPGPEPNNLAIPVTSAESFTVRQSTPPYSVSPGSTPSYFSSDAFSPQSFSDESNQIVGSPDVYDRPSTSRQSMGPLPSVLPNSSDDEQEDINQEGTNELRKLIDNKFKEYKKYEWIQANNEDVPALLSELRKLICRDRLTDRKLVKIYAVIEAIRKQNGALGNFFREENNILSFVAMKKHPLLLKYIVETIQKLGLNPKDLKESPTTVLGRVIEQNQDMREILNTLLSMKNKNNSPVFDINEIDQNGFTVIHLVLMKIKQSENPEMKKLAIEYLRICLEHRPNFQLITPVNFRTYLHHAITLHCGPEVVEMILSFNEALNPDFDLVNRKDINGDCALRLAARTTENRYEVENILRRYNGFFQIEDILNNL